MAITAQERRPATWDEYQSLGEDVRAEYIDGEIVMSPSPSKRHQDVVFRLRLLLSSSLPDGYDVTQDWSWKPAGQASEFIPDVMVHPICGESIRFTGQPLLCVEVTTSNSSNDYITKAAQYAQAGLPHYWIIDQQVAKMDVLGLADGYYGLAQQVATGEPADVSFGSSTVAVDLAALLA